MAFRLKTSAGSSDRCGGDGDGILPYGDGGYDRGGIAGRIDPAVDPEGDAIEEPDGLKLGFGGGFVGFGLRCEYKGGSRPK